MSFLFRVQAHWCSTSWSSQLNNEFSSWVDWPWSQNQLCGTSMLDGIDLFVCIYTCLPCAVVCIMLDGTDLFVCIYTCLACAVVCFMKDYLYFTFKRLIYGNCCGITQCCNCRSVYFLTEKWAQDLCTAPPHLTCKRGIHLEIVFCFNIGCGVLWNCSTELSRLWAVSKVKILTTS